MEVKFYKDENADAFYVRRKVFVEEQNIPECDEFDGSDIGVIQAVVYDNNSPVATGRLIKVENEMRIGRVAVLKEYRGTGTGKYLTRSNSRLRLLWFSGLWGIWRGLHRR